MAAAMFGSAMNTDLTRQALPALWRFYERIDQVRVGQGNWLESLGWGPKETPSRIVLHRPGLTLRGYTGTAGHGPLILLVPAPIKRGYVPCPRQRRDRQNVSLA